MALVTVVGTASNAKAGAVVQSGDTGDLYFIRGVSEWSDEISGKTVEVTGRLESKVHHQQSTPECQVTEMVGEQKIIVDAEYKVV